MHFLTVYVQYVKSIIDILLRYDYAHADTHIEGVEHIALADAADLCDKVEYRKQTDAFAFDDRTETVRNAARNIFIKTAARDVRNTLHFNLFKQCKNGFYVYFCGREKRFAEAFVPKIGKRSFQIGVFDIEHLSDKRKAV